MHTDPEWQLTQVFDCSCSVDLFAMSLQNATTQNEICWNHNLNGNSKCPLPTEYRILFVLFTRLICDWCQLLHRNVPFYPGRSWQTCNKSLCFCHAPPSHEAPTHSSSGSSSVPVRAQGLETIRPKINRSCCRHAVPGWTACGYWDMCLPNWSSALGMRIWTWCRRCRLLLQCSQVERPIP